MRILLAGGTGTIGRRLVEHLIRHGHALTVLSRQEYRPASLPAKLTFVQWDARTAAGWGQHIEEVDAVVNLAGAGLADARWTDERKKLIRDSRVQAGQALVEAIGAANRKPKVLIQSSAVGYYGVDRDSQAITEESGPGNDFLAEVCQAWEASTREIEAMGVRHVIIRSGVILDPQGGAFPKMAVPYRFMAGGPIGSGRQWMSWIHYIDEVDTVRFLLEHEAASGPFNLTAPNPVTSREFARTLGQVMHRPALAPAPAFVFKLAFGEMATVLLDGQRVLPGRLEALGYSFKFPHLAEALQSIVDQYILVR